MKDTVEVIINEGGLTCTTVNSRGILLDKHDDYYLWFDQDGSPQYNTTQYVTDLMKWHQAESERKTYEIENADTMEPLCECIYGAYQCKYPKCIKYTPGTTHKAIINNGKAVICPTE